MTVHHLAYNAGGEWDMYVRYDLSFLFDVPLIPLTSIPDYDTIALVNEGIVPEDGLCSCLSQSCMYIFW